MACPGGTVPRSAYLGRGAFGTRKPADGQAGLAEDRADGAFEIARVDRNADEKLGMGPMVKVVVAALDAQELEACPLQRPDDLPGPEGRQLPGHPVGIWTSTIVARALGLAAPGAGRGRPVARSASR